MRIHIVQKGDTLWNIAKKYGVDFEQLKSMNTQLSNPDMIMPGMKIKVPQGTKQVKKEAPKQSAPKKEMPKQQAPKKEKPSQPPYKDTSPKPIPSIKEDEKKPAPKGVMEKPMQPMQPINMKMPITMPNIDQHMQNYYTTFHLPQMPMPQTKEEYTEESPKEEVKDTKTSPMPEQPDNHWMPEQHYNHNQPMPQQQYNQPTQQQPYSHPMQPQPYSQPMQPQLVHTDFYCCPPHPVMMPMQPQPLMPMHNPMHNPHNPMHMMGDDESDDDMVQGVQAGGDCGCGGGGHDQGPHAYGPMMGPMGGYPQSWQQTPYGGMQHPMGYGQPQPQQGWGQQPQGWGQQPQQGWGQQPQQGWGQPNPQQMGPWNPQQMGQGYQQQPWRDDDVDES